MTGRSILGALTFLVATVAATPSFADRVEKAEALVTRAAQTLDNFANDPDLAFVRNRIGEAKAVIIAPSVVKAGLIFGGSGGDAVLVARNETGAGWSQPAFYTIGSVTFGLQAGGEVSEVVLLVMTTKGVDELLRSSVSLGGDISVAAGPVGVGAKAQTADVLAFSRAKGLYGGLNLEGAVIKVRNRWNRDYYGRQTTPTDVVVRGGVSNAQADILINALRGLEAAGR